MTFDEFIQKSSKAELASLVRRYENSMKRRKKFVSLEEFYNQLHLPETTEENAEKTAEQFKGGEDKK